MAMQSGFIKRIRDIMRMDAGINGDAQRIEQMVWMLFLKVYDAKEDDWELNEDNFESIIPEDLRWRNWAKADSNGHAMTGDKLLNFVNNSIEGWTPFSNPRIFAKYGRQRGWERTPPSGNELSATGSNLPDGFRELTKEEARQMELPF